MHSCVGVNTQEQNKLNRIVAIQEYGRNALILVDSAGKKTPTDQQIVIVESDIKTVMTELGKHGLKFKAVAPTADCRQTVRNLANASLI